MKILLMTLFFLTGALQADPLPILELLSKRYSGYQFDNFKEVSRIQVQALLEAAILAPSSYNEQPWYFIVCNRSTDIKAYKEVLSTFVEFNRKWAEKAPLFIIVVSGMKSSHNSKWNRWAQFDTGAAVMALSLEATLLGLMTHQIGGFDVKRVQRAFSIPEGFLPMSVIAVGYPSSEEVQKKRERKGVEENCFEGRWGRSIKKP